MLVVSLSTYDMLSIGFEDDLKLKAHQSKGFWNLVLGWGWDCVGPNLA